MMFKHYYPLIPISRPLKLAFATGCVAAGAAYYLYRSFTKSEDSSSSEFEEDDSSLDISNELGPRPHLTSSRLSLLDDEAGPSGVKNRDYSSSTSECTTDLSGNKLECSDPPVELDESSFGDVVLVLKDDRERIYDESSDTPEGAEGIRDDSEETSGTPDDTYNDVAKDWFSDLQSTTSEEDRNYEIEYVDFYDRY